MRIYERPDMQCIAIDDGVRCTRGVRNRKRMLCNMHNSRWQRHGTYGFGRHYIDEDSKKEHQRLARQRREEQLRKSWSTLMCLCTHPYGDHMTKGGCLIKNCPCRLFSGASVQAVKQMKDRMTMMGFTKPIGDRAYCQHCQEYVQIGRWFDGNVISRMREHLKSHLVPKRAIEIYRATG